MNSALDACAMIAYLRAEPGFAVVASLLADPDHTCYAHTINLLEVYYDLFAGWMSAALARLFVSLLRME